VQSKREATPLTVEMEPDAQQGTSSSSKGKRRVGLFSLLRYKWGESLLRTVVGELCNICLRIAAILAEPILKYGPAIPDDPRQDGQMPFHQACIYGLSCSEDIRQLSRKHRWMGPLDQQLAAEAHQLGAAWALRTLDSCRESDDKEPVQNSCDPPKSHV
jgi:hypothetical protein